VRTFWIDGKKPPACSVGGRGVGAKPGDHKRYRSVDTMKMLESSLMEGSVLSSSKDPYLRYTFLTICIRAELVILVTLVHADGSGLCRYLLSVKHDTYLG